MSFDCSIKEISPTSLEMQVAGNLDEEAYFPSEFDFSNFKNIYIDFSLVNFVNSGGIKVWVTFSEKMSRFEDLNIHFKKCNRAIVNQVNRTVGFLGPNATILSLYIPVFCNKCDTSMNVYQELPIKNLNQDKVFDKIESCHCGPSKSARKHWEIDIIEEEFFKFLKKN